MSCIKMVNYLADFKSKNNEDCIAIYVHCQVVISFLGSTHHQAAAVHAYVCVDWREVGVTEHWLAVSPPQCQPTVAPSTHHPHNVSQLHDCLLIITLHYLCQSATWLSTHHQYSHYTICVSQQQETSMSSIYIHSCVLPYVHQRVKWASDSILYLLGNISIYEILQV